MDTLAVRSESASRIALGMTQTDEDRIEEPTLSGTDVRRRALSGLVTLGLRSLITRGLGLLGNVALARLLAPEAFGYIAFGYALVVLGGYISTGGLAASLVNRAEPPRRAELQSVVAFQLLLTLAAAAIMGLLGFVAGTTAWLAAIMMLSLPFDVLKGPNALGLERQLNYRPLATVEVVEILAYNILAVGSVLAGAGVWGVAVAAVMRAVIGSALLSINGPYGLVGPRWSWHLVRPLLGFGVRFQASGLVMVARDQGLNLVISAIAGIATLGLWSVAWRLLQTVYLLFESLLRVLFPAMARLLEQEGSIGPTLERGIRLASTSTGLAVVPLIGCSHLLVPVVFGERWNETAAILPWAGVALLISGPVSASVNGFLYARGDASTVLRLGTVQALIWVVGTAVLLPLLGPVGIGIAMLLSALVELALYDRAVSVATGIHPAVAVLPPCVCAIAAGVGGLLLEDHFSANVMSLALLIAVVQIAYLLLMMVTGNRQVLIQLLRLGRTALGRA
jgi:O-antigen/teichoic acid export membrane protein